MNDILFVGEHSRTFEVQWHTHECWELVYCTGGIGVFQLENGTQIQYRAGEVVAIPPGARHANRSQEGFTNIHMQMDDPSFPYQTAFQVPDGGEGHLKSAFSQARYYYLSDNKGQDMVLSALGDLITSYLVVFRDSAEFSQPVEQIRSLIIRDYANPDFALDEAIRALPFHYDYVRKRFKKEVGMTPLEYMTKLRIKKAKGMLSGTGATGYTVAEVAELCGYENALYFSRVFKKHEGVSPSAFAGGRRGGA
ncbi:MAG: helix-turn-helix transcriptional regulator [Oscillospiraceae bacterium]|nr:helix-turn-helix transcriptional regulator [Oscillospiraceae bacterium]